jgi:hypothetical protein
LPISTKRRKYFFGGKKKEKGILFLSKAGYIRKGFSKNSIKKLLLLSVMKNASKKCRQMKFFVKRVPGYACISLIQ